jgi:hypothetical protein
MGIVTTAGCPVRRHHWPQGPFARWPFASLGSRSPSLTPEGSTDLFASWPSVGNKTGALQGIRRGKAGLISASRDDGMWISNQRGE